jgi:hypothetical protein
LTFSDAEWQPDAPSGLARFNAKLFFYAGLYHIKRVTPISQTWPRPGERQQQAEEKEESAVDGIYEPDIHTFSPAVSRVPAIKADERNGHSCLRSLIRIPSSADMAAAQPSDEQMDWNYPLSTTLSSLDTTTAIFL